MCWRCVGDALVGGLPFRFQSSWSRRPTLQPPPSLTLSTNVGRTSVEVIHDGSHIPKVKSHPPAKIYRRQIVINRAYFRTFTAILTSWAFWTFVPLGNSGIFWRYFVEDQICCSIIRQTCTYRNICKPLLIPVRLRFTLRTPVWRRLFLISASWGQAQARKVWPTSTAFMPLN